MPAISPYILPQRKVSMAGAIPSVRRLGVRMSTHDQVQSWASITGPAFGSETSEDISKMVQN